MNFITQGKYFLMNQKKKKLLQVDHTHELSGFNQKKLWKIANLSRTSGWVREGKYVNEKANYDSISWNVWRDDDMWAVKMKC